MTVKSIFESYYENKSAFISVDREIKENVGLDVHLLQKKRNRLLIEIEFVDKLLPNFTEEQKKIIEMRMQKITWSEIGGIMLMDRSNAMRKYNKAFKNLEEFAQNRLENRRSQNLSDPFTR